MDKNLNRQKTNDTMIGSFIAITFLVVIMIFVQVITSEVVMALGLIYGYLGNHTIQNYRTTPTKEK